MNKYFRSIILIIGLFNIIGCSGGAGFEEESKQTNWLTEPTYFGADTIIKDDVLKPVSIINIMENRIEKSDIVLEAELQQAVNKGGVITFETANKDRTIKLSKQLYI